MAKENREAGHMLGHNDPKNDTKTTETQAQMRKGAETMTTASANKQLKQCSGQVPLHTYEKSIACVC